MLKLTINPKSGSGGGNCISSGCEGIVVFEARATLRYYNVSLNCCNNESCKHFALFRAGEIATNGYNETEGFHDIFLKKQEMMLSK